jgi:hypothetical protein
MSAYPPQVEASHEAMRRLVAVGEVTAGPGDLAKPGPETCSFPVEFGDLPHALLRRTEGGPTEERWANTEFGLSRDEAGWLTLEFLAWWVRDLSRAGEQFPMRPLALPPETYEVQFGRTLEFIIDRFIHCPGGELTPALERLQDPAESLNTSSDDDA